MCKDYNEKCLVEMLKMEYFGEKYKSLDIFNAQNMTFDEFGIGVDKKDNIFNLQSGLELSRKEKQEIFFTLKNRKKI